MGVLKDQIIEESYQETVDQENYCDCCGEPLSEEAKEADRQECFACYCENQD